MKTYLIQQKIKPIVNQYAIYEATAAGEPGPLVGFAQQKRFSFKEKFTVYGDETKQSVSFAIQARQVLDFGARYDVSDANNMPLGVIGKDFASSLLRSTWHIYIPGQEDAPALVVQERNKTLAIIRRAWEFLPYISDLPFFVKYHFDFTDTATQQVVASYVKTTTFRDHYRLDIQENASHYDPRVLIALGIMLDALQSR
jgi:uncharacterized protein YxjI